MKQVTNTENKPRPEWLMGGNPQAIEAQEAQGQKELVESSQLPSKCNYPSIKIDIIKQYEAMGIKVIGQTKGDEMFLDVVLPAGWKKKGTGHSMWSELLDDKNRIRATIFYKAAFYDRDSFINFEYRYVATRKYLGRGEGAKIAPKYYCVTDCGEDIFKTKITEEYEDAVLEMQAQDFLKENFPNHKDLNAYWD